MAIPDRVEQINAVEAAKAEILAALAATNGKIDAGVTAQTKAFTEFVSGTMHRNDEPVFVTGSGRAWFSSSYGGNVSGLIDGDEFSFKITKEMNPIVIYFESSLQFYYSDSNSGLYVIQT